MHKNLLLTISLACIYNTFSCATEILDSTESKPKVVKSTPELEENLSNNKIIQATPETEQALFDKPDGFTSLASNFLKTSEGKEVMDEDELAEISRESTKEFMKTKYRKEFDPEEQDPFFNCLRNGDLPITYFTGLSIDGGGMRGIIPAVLLDYLSHKLSHPLYKYFDYIGGTSIGGILALGLTAPSFTDPDKQLLQTSQLVQLFEQRGQDIFPNGTQKEFSWYHLHTKLWSGLKYLAKKAKSTVVSQYTADNLEKLLKEKFGTNTYLHQTLTNTLITAVDTSNSKSQTYLFDSQEASMLNNQKDIMIPVWEVGRATSAAPTYFPAYTLQIKNKDGKTINGMGTRLVDGGLWVNNPAALVARSVLKWASNQSMHASHKNMVILSLGTGYSEEGHQLHGNVGTIRAAIPVIDTLMNISSFSIHETMSELLGKNNYKRINPQLDKEVGLDETDPSIIEEFKEVAKKQEGEIDKFINGPFRRILEADYLPKDKPSNNTNQ